MEVDDQKNDRKIDIPAHVLYSVQNLGAQFDVLGVWQNWTHLSAGLAVQGIGGGRGHFIVEEAPGKSANCFHVRHQQR